jgi:hypothetical protein
LKRPHCWVLHPTLHRAHPLAAASEAAFSAAEVAARAGHCHLSQLRYTRHRGSGQLLFACSSSSLQVGGAVSLSATYSYVPPACTPLPSPPPLPDAVTVPEVHLGVFAADDDGFGPAFAASLYVYTGVAGVFGRLAWGLLLLYYDVSLSFLTQLCAVTIGLAVAALALYVRVKQPTHSVIHSSAITSIALCVLRRATQKFSS